MNQTRSFGTPESELELLSLVRGRASLRYSRLRRCRALAEGIETELRRLSGIRQVEASPLTARVLVFYDPAQAHLERISAAIRTALPLGPAEMLALEELAPDELRADRRRLI